MDVVFERVVDELSIKFMDVAIEFATGPSYSREGRAPYLRVLKWLSQAQEPTISIEHQMNKHPESWASVFQIVDRGHLAKFLSDRKHLSDLMHFDPKTRVLALEDPSFHFFLQRLQWAKFTERVGYRNIGFKTQYDFALSFAGADRDIAEAIYRELTAREFAVFYDYSEQSRILAADLEEYLAPIYSSEASFVLCVMGPTYPNRIWTRFESRQFKARFGAESVVPIWVDGATPGMFDEAGRVGGYFFKAAHPVEPQVKYLAELLEKKIAEYRINPPPGRGRFRCRACFLVLPTETLAHGRTSICVDCVGKAGVYLGATPGN